MRRSSFFLLILLSVATALDLGQVDVSQLGSTRVCEADKVCSFDATLSFLLSEQALAANGSINAKNAKIDLDIEFRVTPQQHCPPSPSSNRFFRLDVVQVSGTAQKRGIEASKNPLFFAQNDKTGDVSHIYVAASEGKGLKRLKKGLVRSLAKQLRQDLISHAKNESVSYVFEQQDVSGKFVAHHELRAVKDEHELMETGPDGVVLVETRTYTNPGVLVQKSALKSKQVLTADGHMMAAKQKEKTKIYFTGVGEVVKIKVKDQVSIGSAQESPLSLEEKPLVVEPSLGKTKANVDAVIRRKANDVFTPASQCKVNATATTTEDEVVASFEADVQISLGSFHKEAMNDADNSDDEDDDMNAEEQLFAANSNEEGIYDPTQVLLQAENLLSSGHFEMQDVSPLLRPSTVKVVLDHAWRLYHDGNMNMQGMQAVLGSLSGIRCTAAYDQLLTALRNRDLPQHLREQAAVSLLHTKDENPAPAFVCNEVADIATAEGDSEIGQVSTMLLGSLLDRAHAAADGVAHHLGHLRVRLSQFRPVDDETNANTVVALLHSLRNAGDAASQTYIMPFVDSPIRRVRLAALGALHRLQKSSARGNSAFGNVAELDENSGLMAGANGDEVFSSLINNMEVGSGSGSSSSSGSLFGDDEDDLLSASTSVLLEEDLMFAADASSSSSSPATASSASAATTTVLGAPSSPSVEKNLNIAGNKDFDVRGSAKVDASWSQNQAGASGESGLTGRVYAMNTNLVKTSFIGNIAHQADASKATPGFFGGPNSTIDVTLTLGPHVISSKSYKYDATLDMQDVANNGAEHDPQCPTNLRTASGSFRRSPVIFNRQFLSTKARFVLGFIPLSVESKVAGAVGYRVIYSSYENCVDQDSKNQEDMGVIVGASSLARAKVNAKLGMDIGVAAAGAGADVTVFDGEVPAYALTFVHKSVANVDLSVRPLNGRVYLYADTFTRRDKDILDWQSSKAAVKPETTVASSSSSQISSNVGFFSALQTKVDLEQSQKQQAAAATLKHNQHVVAAKRDTLLQTNGDGSDSSSSAASAAAALQAVSVHQQQAEEASEHATSDIKRAISSSSSDTKSMVRSAEGVLAADVSAAESASANVARHEGDQAVSAATKAGHKAASAANAAGSKAAKAAKSAEKTASDEGARDRQVDRQQGKDSRGTTRKDAERSRAAVRDTSKTIESQVSSSAQAVKSTVRKDDGKDRDTTRDMEWALEKVLKAESAENRAELRHEEEQFEANSGRREREIERDMKNLGSKMTSLQDDERDSRLRNMMRRQTSAVEEKDKEIESQLHREDERKEIRDVEKKQEKGVESVEGQLHREDDRRRARREGERIDGDERRSFQNERERERIDNVKKVVGDEKSIKDSLRKGVDQVSDKMRREDAQRHDDNRARRMEKRVERSAGDERKVEKEISKLGKDVDREGDRARRGERRAKDEILKKDAKAADRIEASSEQDRIKDTIRRKSEDAKQDTEFRDLSKSERHNAQKIRDETRAEAGKEEKQMESSAAENKLEKNLRRGREQGRSLAERQRASSRKSASRISRAQQRASDASSERQQLSSLQQSAGKASNEARRAGARVLEDVKNAGKESLARERQVAEDSSRTERRADREERRNARRVKQEVKRNAIRAGEQNRREDSRMARADRRDYASTDRSIRKTVKSDDQEEKWFHNRMERRSKRRDEHAKNAEKRFDQRSNRIGARAESSLAKLAAQDSNRLQRRSARKGGEFSSVELRDVERLGKLKAKDSNRFNRVEARTERAYDQRTAHDQSRLARLEARADVRVGKEKAHDVRRLARDEDRAATGLSSENKRFNERSARSQAEMVAMTKPDKG